MADWSSFSPWPVGARTMPHPERPQERQYRAGRAGASSSAARSAASAQRKAGPASSARSTRVTSRTHRVISTLTARWSGIPFRPARMADRAARMAASARRASPGSWPGPMSVRASSAKAVARPVARMRARTSGWDWRAEARREASVSSSDLSDRSYRRATTPRRSASGSGEPVSANRARACRFSAVRDLRRRARLASPVASAARLWVSAHCARSARVSVITAFAARSVPKTSRAKASIREESLPSPRVADVATGHTGPSGEAVKVSRRGSSTGRWARRVRPRRRSSMATSVPWAPS